jgi:ABC-type glutathione transport system ATPase component
MTDPTTTSDAHATAAHEAGATDAVAAHDAPVQAAHAAAEAHASGQPALPSRASDETPVIAAEHVWKRFAVNEYRPSLRHEAFSLFRSFFRRDEPTGEPFWALKDITFAVYRGESVGIIGHNGAGKSTLFRVLCGISEPTRGEVRVQGRFAPLIALTAGFNMELSGRRTSISTAPFRGCRAGRPMRSSPIFWRSPTSAHSSICRSSVIAAAW